MRVEKWESGRVRWREGAGTGCIEGVGYMEGIWRVYGGYMTCGGWNRVCGGNMGKE